MNTQQLHERIEDYLSRQLTGEDRRRFDHELQHDEALRDTLAEHQAAQSVLRYAVAREQKARLQAIEAENPVLKRTTPVIVRRIWIRRLAAAAAVILLMSTITVYLVAIKNYSNNAIAQAMYVKPFNDTFRSAPEVTDLDPWSAMLHEADEAFREGNNEKAKMLYLELLRTDNLRRDLAQWNLTLIYFHEDPRSLQFSILMDHILTDADHDYHLKALDLQRKSNSLLFKWAN